MIDIRNELAPSDKDVSCAKIKTLWTVRHHNDNQVYSTEVCISSTVFWQKQKFIFKIYRFLFFFYVFLFLHIFPQWPGEPSTWIVKMGSLTKKKKKKKKKNFWQFQLHAEKTHWNILQNRNCSIECNHHWENISKETPLKNTFKFW